MTVEAPTGRSNRGFWFVLLPMAVGGLLLVVLIIAFRPTVKRNADALVQSNLRAAVAAARDIRDVEGSFTAARPLRLREELPDILFIDPDESSNEPGIVSVYTAAGTWAGAARADTGECFWIRIGTTGDPELGTGTDCSGDEVSTAPSNGWPED
jgi:hypothetical protein